MNITITGHTSGLGLAIYNAMLARGHNVRGFSRSCGWDISTQAEEIGDIVSESDLFFNNAHYRVAQSTLLQLTYSNVSVITSGSMAAAGVGEYHPNPYFREKAHIERTHVRLKHISPYPMLLLRMGYLENYPENYPIKYSTIINAIDFWLDNPRVSMIEFENDPKIYTVNQNR